METKAEKIYDKLNRVYYRKAKALDMSAPNYIMSNIINDLINAENEILDFINNR